ncbi:4-hydroxythreonine-4-phosphate dehydrogenase PdxA [Oceanomicrobium pacificus]|uniref:4-hydroxythreonine-4-phosphate dehydrogenase n=1 Tax=Oceanomicrobium pacificus TaxID=2692916 RepID=A0A6B0TSI9_9RHOB|nr:4-hydroxythreonine-4-phosphate dehydrogenase PdxA [Oceanomicrobium pacificus]MXU65709.1 4-hydroxythreonine-4-phosphate dehydrogenase PdxA [Oceanomicrobium pacificus]
MPAPLALTSGDPAGIGPELSFKAWTALNDRLPFYLISDIDRLGALAEKTRTPIRAIGAPGEAIAVMADGLPVLHRPFAASFTPGAPDPANAPAIIDAIELAVDHAQAGLAGAVVTNPINKAGLKAGAGFAFPGHTEFLADLCGTSDPVMLLAAPELRVVPATIHIALQDVPEQLTADGLEAVIRQTHAGLQRDFGIAAPRIAVAGLNPHAGEDGRFGKQEIEIISPLLDRLRAEGLDLRGPLPADTMFHARARASYDCAVCMYHDQALIPIKTLDFDRGVNVTLGLPILRTSPDHGTAYDIAGQGIARPDSLIAALELAGQLAARRGAVS